MKTQHENLGSDLTGQIIGAAIAVQREFGPGLDEADYEQALHLELLAMGIEHECQMPLPLENGVSRNGRRVQLSDKVVGP